jgi:hypothetical protein
MLLDQVLEKKSGDDGRNGADNQKPDQVCVGIIPAQEPRHRAEEPGDVRAKVNENGDQRADVTRHVEGESELVAVEPKKQARQDQVSGARNRQELGEPLNNAEQSRLYRGRHARKLKVKS